MIGFPTGKANPHFKAKVGLASHPQRMADLTGCTAAAKGGGQGQLRADRSTIGSMGSGTSTEDDMLLDPQIPMK
jgi:hypothetical protein